MAKVVLTPAAQQQFAELPLYVKGRVQQVLERLTAWPNVSGAKPLRGKLAGQYRMRTGDYRVQFHPKGHTVYVTRIGHRDGFYDE
jgi:mRNA-degrading endonuclease RelE of RelBE toxin-antitoxin system